MSPISPSLNRKAISRRDMREMRGSDTDPITDLLESIHEADGIYYDGNIENFNWEMSILPGCASFSDSVGLNAAELPSFFELLNVGDILYRLYSVASYSDTLEVMKFTYKGNWRLYGSLIAVLQDRLLIVTKGHSDQIITGDQIITHDRIINKSDYDNPTNFMLDKGNSLEIPYSEIKKVEGGRRNTALGIRSQINKFHEFIEIELLDGTIIKSYPEQRFTVQRDIVNWITKKKGSIPYAEEVDKPKLEYQWLSSPLGTTEDPSYDNLSVKDLKGILRKRGLSVGGGYASSDGSTYLDEAEYKLKLIARLKGEDYDFSLEPWKSSDRTFHEQKPIDEKDIPEVTNLQNKYKSKNNAEYFKSQKPEVPDYPTSMSILFVVLFCMFLFATYSFFANGVYDDNVVNQPWLLPLYILSFMVIFFTKWKTETLQLNVRPNVTNVADQIFLVVTILSILFWTFGTYWSDIILQILSSVTCSTSVIMLMVIAFVFSSVKTIGDIRFDEKLRFVEEAQTRRVHFDAIKCENNGYFDRAKKIWMRAGLFETPNEIKRIEKLEIEIEYVRVKRSILELKEKGINCEKLEKRVNQEFSKLWEAFESSSSDHQTHTIYEEYDYLSMTKSELIELAQTIGLSTSGTKKDLISRLEEY
jgi:hypothetical protein